MEEISVEGEEKRVSMFEKKSGMRLKEEEKEFLSSNKNRTLKV